MAGARPKSIRVALVGYGYAGRTFHGPYIEAVRSLALSVVASRNAGKVHADVPGAEVVSDPLEAIHHESIDLVVIASPNADHAPLARAALLAGKHVVVEKPFTLDATEARELCSLATRQDRLLSVFHNRRWDSDYLSIRQAIEQGFVGRVTHFESSIDRYRPEVRQRWREQDGPGGGLWLDLGPHLVDQALQLFGIPDSVSASLARQRDGAVADDWVHVVLDYGQCRVVLHASVLAAAAAPRFRVHGTLGSMVKQDPDAQEKQLQAGLRPGSADWGRDDDALVVTSADGMTHRRPALRGDQATYYRAIAESLLSGTPNPVPPTEALAIMAVLDAAAKSAAQRRAIVPYLTAEERASLAK
jgi:predicted dehydrogenase